MTDFSKHMPNQAEVNEKAVQAAGEFLQALGLDLKQLGMEKTPYRVAMAFSHFFSGLREDPEDCWGELIPTQSDGLVAVRNIRFYSMCEHHLLPFFGTVHIAYYPAEGRIAGFGHFAEVVDVLARRPQLQERFTYEICKAVQDGLGARGALVIVRGTHLCLSMRNHLGGDSDIITQVWDVWPMAPKRAIRPGNCSWRGMHRNDETTTYLSLERRQDADRRGKDTDHGHTELYARFLF